MQKYVIATKTIPPPICKRVIFVKKNPKQKTPIPINKIQKRVFANFKVKKLTSKTTGTS